MARPGAAYCSKLRRQPKVLSARFALMQCVRNRAISDTVGIHVKLGRVWRAVWKQIIYFVTHVFSVNVEQKMSHLYVGNFRRVYQTKIGNFRHISWTFFALN